MALLKGREMVFETLESGMFSKTEQSKQSEQLEQTTSNYEYTPLKLNNDLNMLINVSNNIFSSDIGNQLFIPIKKGTGLKTLTPQ